MHSGLDLWPNFYNTSSWKTIKMSNIPPCDSTHIHVWIGHKQTPWGDCRNKFCSDFSDITSKECEAKSYLGRQTVKPTLPWELLGDWQKFSRSIRAARLLSQFKIYVKTGDTFIFNSTKWHKNPLAAINYRLLMMIFCAFFWTDKFLLSEYHTTSAPFHRFRRSQMPSGKKIIFVKRIRNLKASKTFFHWEVNNKSESNKSTTYYKQ